MVSINLGLKCYWYVVILYRRIIISSMYILYGPIQTCSKLVYQLLKGDWDVVQAKWHSGIFVFGPFYLTPGWLRWWLLYHFSREFVSWCNIPPYLPPQLYLRFHPFYGNVYVRLKTSLIRFKNRKPSHVLIPSLTVCSSTNASAASICRMKTSRKAAYPVNLGIVVSVLNAKSIYFYYMSCLHHFK